MLRAPFIWPGCSRAGVQHMVFSSSASVYGTPRRLRSLKAQRSVRRMCTPSQKQRWSVCFRGSAKLTASLGEPAISMQPSEPRWSDWRNWSVTTNLVPLVMKVLLVFQARCKCLGTTTPRLMAPAFETISMWRILPVPVAALDYLVAGGQAAEPWHGCRIVGPRHTCPHRNEAGHEIPYEWSNGGLVTLRLFSLILRCRAFYFQTSNSPMTTSFKVRTRGTRRKYQTERARITLMNFVRRCAPCAE